MRTAHLCYSEIVCTRLHLVAFQKTVVSGDPEVRYSGRVHSISQLTFRQALAHDQDSPLTVSYHKTGEGRNRFLRRHSDEYNVKNVLKKNWE